VSCLLLVGTGQVAVRAARQIVDTDGVDALDVASLDRGRAEELCSTVGGRAVVDGRDARIPDGIAAVVVATHESTAAPWLLAAQRAGIPVATTIDRPGIERVVGGGTATVVSGCTLVPGLADVLARHAAAAFDSVDEVHVARVGAAGPACAEELRRARREPATEWSDGHLVAARPLGAQLVWFPEPVGAVECHLTGFGAEATAVAVGGARQVTVRFGPPPPARRRLPFGRRPSVWAAVRVEVWGWVGGERRVIVYGVVDRAAVAAGTALGVVGAAVAGSLPGVLEPGAGVRTLGTAVVPAAFLGELARRGVKAAAFEGARAG
jgi:hypothetical protein